MNACFVALALALASTAALAQRSDCPRQDAPIPHRPPGKPPSFTPPFRPPARPGEPVNLVPMVLPPADEFIDGEEGHVAEPLLIAKSASRIAPASSRLASRAPIENTPLAAWRFAGYGRDPSPHRLLRAYQRDGMTVVVEVSDMGAQGMTVLGSAPPNVQLGTQPALQTAVRSPSGCVNAYLSWSSERVMRSLSAAGPLALEAQRRLLLEIGQAMVRGTQAGPRP